MPRLGPLLGTCQRPTRPAVRQGAASGASWGWGRLPPAPRPPLADRQVPAPAPQPLLTPAPLRCAAASALQLGRREAGDTTLIGYFTQHPPAVRPDLRIIDYLR
jgi:hypothetical protein